MPYCLLQQTLVAFLKRGFYLLHYILLVLVHAFLSDLFTIQW